MEYFGEQIELIQQPSGWVGIWRHSAGLIEIGYFVTAMAAWEGVVELIQRDAAVRSLLHLVEEWRETTAIDDCEYALTAQALVDSVLV